MFFVLSAPHSCPHCLAQPEPPRRLGLAQFGHHLSLSKVTEGELSARFDKSSGPGLCVNSHVWSTHFSFEIPSVARRQSFESLVGWFHLYAHRFNGSTPGEDCVRVGELVLPGPCAFQLGSYIDGYARCSHFMPSLCRLLASVFE